MPFFRSARREHDAPVKAVKWKAGNEPHSSILRVIDIRHAPQLATVRAFVRISAEALLINSLVRKIPPRGDAMGMRAHASVETSIFS